LIIDWALKISEAVCLEKKRRRERETRIEGDLIRLLLLTASGRAVFSCY
jgi:hypothetical protein